MVDNTDVVEDIEVIDDNLDVDDTDDGDTKAPDDKGQQDPKQLTAAVKAKNQEIKQLKSQIRQLDTTTKQLKESEQNLNQEVLKLVTNTDYLEQVQGIIKEKRPDLFKDDGKTISKVGLPKEDQQLITHYQEYEKALKTSNQRIDQLEKKIEQGNLELSKERDTRMSQQFVSELHGKVSKLDGYAEEELSDIYDKALTKLSQSLHDRTQFPNGLSLDKAVKIAKQAHDKMVAAIDKRREERQNQDKEDRRKNFTVNQDKAIEKILKNEKGERRHTDDQWNVLSQMMTSDLEAMGR